MNAPQDLGPGLAPPAAKVSRIAVVIVSCALVGGAFGFGYLQHRKSHEILDVAADGSQPVEVVEVVEPTVVKGDQAITLSAVARALEETKIYPRTSGYVRKWLADIGDKVKAGQVLAEIETPDLDAQLAQARAQLESARAAVKQAKAQAVYSKGNAERNVTMGEQNLVAKATVEQAEAQAGVDAAIVAADEANVAAAEANVRHLSELHNFATVVAPFAGTITQRTIDRGSLVSDNGTTPMFVLDATDPIRVLVDVPQTVASNVKIGISTLVTSREYGARTFPGKVMHTAGALDPDLHTMTTEIQIPNADGALLPGMYVLATINLPVPREVLEIPATALYNDSSGLRVAVVTAQNKIHYATITIERDTGSAFWVATGLTGGERIVKTTRPLLVEGDRVEVKQASAAAKK